MEGGVGEKGRGVKEDEEPQSPLKTMPKKYANAHFTCDLWPQPSLIDPSRPVLSFLRCCLRRVVAGSHGASWADSD